MPDRQTALVFGARNLGRAVLERLSEQDWNLAGSARSEVTLQGIRDLGGLALEADVTDPAAVQQGLKDTAAHYGGRVDLAVNAASAYGGTRTGPFGGGPIAEASPTAFDDRGAAPAPGAFTVPSRAAPLAPAPGGA